jgi:hypothetical protein
MTLPDLGYLEHRSWPYQIVAILVRPFDFFAYKAFKLSGFQIFWLWAYLMICSVSTNIWLLCCSVWHMFIFLLFPRTICLITMHVPYADYSSVNVLDEHTVDLFICLAYQGCRLHNLFICFSYRNRGVYCIILLFVLATVTGVYTASSFCLF